MNEEYLNGYFETFVSPERPDVSYDDWVSKISSNEDYKRGMFESQVKPKKPDSTYEDWDSKVFGTDDVKKKFRLENPLHKMVRQALQSLMSKMRLISRIGWQPIQM